MRFSMNRLFVLLTVVALAGTGAANAADIPRVRIGDPEFKPLPIAITKPIGANDAEKGLGEQIAAVVTNNLRGTGLFRTIDPAAFIQKIETAPPLR